MATTTNYGWDTPDDTDLVKDGAAAIRTLGSSVDTTTKNLNPQTTTGALAYRSATANVNTALPIGTAGQVLAVNSGATAPEWKTIGGGGKVLQVVNATYNTATTVASTTFADTGLSLSITPSAATSKILVLAEQSTYNESTNQATQVLEIRLLRDATSIQDFKGVSYVNIGSTGGSNLLVRAPISYLDSPNTTSATTYKIQGRVASTANSAQAIFQVSSSVSTITLLEIGA